MFADPTKVKALEIFEQVKKEYEAAPHIEDLRQMLIQIKTFILFREDYLGLHIKNRLVCTKAPDCKDCPPGFIGSV